MPADDLLLRIAAAFNPAGVRQVRGEVQGLGRFVEGLRPDLELNSAGALRDIREVRTAVAGLPDGEVTVHGDVGEALGELGTVRAGVTGLPDGEVTVHGDVGEALGDIGTVRAGLEGIPDEDVVVRLAAVDALAEIAGIKNALAGIPDAEATVRVSTQEGRGAVSELTEELGEAGLTAAAAGGGFARLGESVGGLKSAAAGLVSIPILGSLVASTRGAAELADSVNATNVVFGEARGEVDRFAESSVRAVGLSERAYRQLVAPLGGLMSSLGFVGDEQARISNEALTLGADFASVYGGEIPEAVGAVGAAFRGETEPIRRYGISLDEASVKAEASRIGLVQLSVDAGEVARAQLNVEKATKAAAEATKAHGAGSLEAREAQLRLTEAQDKLKAALAGDAVELDKNQKARATWSLITRQAGDIQGDFARTADEGVNATRVSSAALSDAADRAGAAFLPIMVKVANVVTTVAEAFGKLPGPVQTGIVVLVGLLGVLAGVAGIVGLVGPLFTGMGATILGVFTGPVGIVLGIAAALAGIVYLIVHNWETISGFFSGLWGHVQEIFSAAGAWITDNVGTIGRVALAVLTGGFSEIVLFFVRHWDDVRRIFGDAIGAVVNFFQELPGRAIGAVSGFGGMLAGWARDAFGWLRGAIGDGIGAAVEWFRELPGRIVGALGDAGGWLVGIGRRIVEGLADGIRGMGRAVVDAIVGLLPGPVRALAGALGLASPSRLFRGFGRQVTIGFALGIRDELEAVYDAVDLLSLGRPDLDRVGELGRAHAAADRARVASAASAPAAGHTFIVNPAPGMDEADLARRVALEQTWADRGRG